MYLKYMDKSKISMITKIDDFGNKILGIEDYIPNAQYQTDEHTNAVVEDIINGWDIISQNSKFHATPVHHSYRGKETPDSHGRPCRTD